MTAAARVTPPASSAAPAGEAQKDAPKN